MRTALLCESGLQRMLLNCIVILGVGCSWVAAKDQPFQVVTWPGSGQPVLRFTFSEFKDIGVVGKEHTYITDAAAENLSEKTISGAAFSLYVFDKSKARIGEGHINLTNVAAGETVRFQNNPFGVGHS
jgi:hypothetical protein